MFSQSQRSQLILQTEQVYNSTEVEKGSALQFSPSKQPHGNLGLEDGYLLTVDGKCEGWTICGGDVEESTVRQLWILTLSDRCIC